MTYRNFPGYVLRAPLLSFSFYKELTQNTSLSEDKLKQVCRDKIIKEAIFLASPSLYNEFEKWLKGDIKDKAASESILYTVLKYISRMSSRCTPFGLFAGTAVGTFSEKTTITLRDKSKNKRHTRLDMNYLVALSQDIVKDKTIRDQLLFYPNTSIYKSGHQLRYVEYKYVNSQRIHHIVAVDHSAYIQKVLVKAQQGALLHNLAALLVDDEITREEANGFIDELVENQLLISELEPSVSGPEFLDQLLTVLKRLKGTEQLISVLENTAQTLQNIDNNLGNTAEEYIALSESLKKLGTDFDLKYMFQTDMLLSPEVNTISTEIVRKVKKGMALLNKLTLPSQETLISRFRAAFYERYEDREVPLSKALDIELGVGFRQDQDSGDINQLVDDLVLPPQDESNALKDVKWSPVHAVLQQKLMACIREQKTMLVIEEEDFNQFKEHWEDLPDTISVMIEMVTIDRREKIMITNTGGSSGANLLGRFCHGDPQLLEHTREIIKLETEMNPDKILAEIIHLPESRAGNILMRPVFRTCEIPYLAKSVLKHKNQLPLHDLMISVRAMDEVKLRSKKYNKEVVPHLTNAHNFSNGALPVYEFLANMQTQNKRSSIGFNWGPFEEEYKFLPGVMYNEIILSGATWNIAIQEVEPLLKCMNNDDRFLEALNRFIHVRRIPQYVLLADGDNELLVNTQNITSVKMLLTTVKKRSKFKLKAFLHTEESLVKEGKEACTNQVILSFYNEKKLKNARENTNG